MWVKGEIVKPNVVAIKVTTNYKTDMTKELDVSGKDASRLMHIRNITEEGTEHMTDDLCHL